MKERLYVNPWRHINDGPRKMKYHYEYEVRIYTSAGDVFLARFRSYVEAIVSVMNEKMGFFNIKKVRVYE